MNNTHHPRRNCSRLHSAVGLSPAGCNGSTNGLNVQPGEPSSFRRSWLCCYSLYLSLSRCKFVKGGFEINFVGLANYKKLLFGLEKTHFLGLLGHPSPLGWLVFIAVAGLLLYALARNLRSGTATVRGIVGSLLSSALVLVIVWLLVATLSQGVRPGTLIVTLLYVFIGIFFQYTIGLILAMLTTQRLPGRRFFRVIFLLPMMITPVGIAYTFLMLVDTP